MIMPFKIEYCGPTIIYKMPRNRIILKLENCMTGRDMQGWVTLLATYKKPMITSHSTSGCHLVVYSRKRADGKVFFDVVYLSKERAFLDGLTLNSPEDF